MLLKKSYTNLTLTKYECDRCKKQGTANEMIKIGIQKPNDKSLTKKWDLCLNCYRSLVRGIKKGVTKKNE